MGSSKEEFVKSLDGLGEAEVRSRLVDKRFNEEKSALARSWLSEKERSREDTAEADRLAIATRAADAAERAASAAEEQARAVRNANRRATIALIIAIASAIIANWEKLAAIVKPFSGP